MREIAGEDLHNPMPTQVPHSSHPLCLCPSPHMQGGNTPLIWAAAHGYLDIVKLLLECGAQKDLQAKVTRREGRKGAPGGL